MKAVFKILIVSVLISSCSLWKSSNQEIVAVVTKKENLDKYVGKLITIKGEIQYEYCGYKYSKYQTIIGVGVYNEEIKDSDMGKNAIATGILKSFEIKEGDFGRREGCAGTHYSLTKINRKYKSANVELLKQ